MSEGNDKKKKKGDTPPAGDKTPDTTVVSMTQAELDQSHTQRADRAARGAVFSLLSDLGYESTDALKEALTGYTEYLATQKSDGEKLTDELAAANIKVTELSTDLTTAQDEMQEYKLRTTILSAAREHNFLKGSLEDVWMLIQSNDDMKNGLKIDPETGKVVGAKATVKKVAEQRPHWVQPEVRKGTPSPKGVGAPASKSGSEKEASTRPLVNF
jgi:hypothetical protein